MRHAYRWWVIPLLCGCVAMQPHLVRAGFVAHPAADSLASWWDPSPDALEHAYCATKWIAGKYRDPAVADSVIVVVEVKRATVDSASHEEIAFRCDPKELPPIHTHPYSRDSLTNCSPSRPDYKSAWGTAFSIVQCSKDAFQFYYPTPAERW